MLFPKPFIYLPVFGTQQKLKKNGSQLLPQPLDLKMERVTGVEPA